MVQLFGADVDRQQIEEYTGRLGQIAGISPFQLEAGRGKGVRGMNVETGGGFSFTCVADRCLDISHAAFAGVPLCWDSPNRVAAPAYYEAADDEWLRTFFGGLLTTAGLTNFGPAGTDEYGSFGLHGRVNCLPADELSWSERWVTEDGTDQCLFEISGTMRQTRVFGENLALRRFLRTRLGSRSLELHDTVRNEGFSPAPHMILYHCNGGYPLLAPGARLYVSHSAMRPRDDQAKNGIEVWDQVAAPQAGFAEQVFVHTPLPLSDGRAAVMLANERLLNGRGLALVIRFNPEQLPALIQWRMFGQGTYVMGMEPANTPTIEGRVAARKLGTLPFLQAGETRAYDLEFQVLTGKDEIGALIAEIQQAK